MEYQVAEDIAALCYERAGFRLLQRNRRSIGSELDLIAYRAMVLHFVEVKLRKVLPTSAAEICELLNPSKRKAMLRGVQQFLERRQEIPPWHTVVLDLLVVTHEGGVRRYGNLEDETLP
jgi:Holliday junction resolvase-like predicted endonuclease